MTQEEFRVLVGVLFSIVCALLVYLWKDKGRRLAAIERRCEALEARVKTVELDIVASSPAVLQQRVTRLEGDYELLHRHKNERLPAILDKLASDIYGTWARIEGEIQRRLEIIERKLFNGHK